MMFLLLNIETKSQNSIRKPPKIYLFILKKREKEKQNLRSNNIIKRMQNPPEIMEFH